MSSLSLCKKDVYGKVYTQTIPLSEAIQLPPQWTAVYQLHSQENVSHQWLGLIGGRVMVYTDMGCLPYAHVTSVPFDTAAFCAYFHDFYEALPDYVVVGHFPFDHSAQYLQQLYAATQSPPAEVLQLNNQVVRWRTAGGQGVTDIKKVGRELRLQPFGEPSAAPVRALWATLFKTPMPQLIPDSPILQCVIPAARIRCRTKQFWKRCVQLYRASGIEYMREHMYNVCDGVNTHTSMDFCTAYAWENIWASLFEPGVEAWQDFRVD